MSEHEAHEGLPHQGVSTEGWKYSGDGGENDENIDGKKKEKIIISFVNINEKNIFKK